MPSLHFIVKGKVHGVFFRKSAKEVADEHCMTGWVKNTLAGEVEIMATGTPLQMEIFIAWCRQEPYRARVSEVIIKTLSDIHFPEFTVMR